MDKSLKDNGKKEKKMVLDFGVHQMEIVMKAIGLMVVSKVKELMLTRIASTKGNSITV
jgi:hypothetical protein